MFSKEEIESFAKASASRDYRFDGRFFTAVKTTKIYCRPVCPARPKRENLEYFRTGQEAEAAGYRPCLRCRPEVSPQSPAWIGTSATVKRGIHLISKGYLFESDEEKFAAKLGIGARHLRRLFVDEIGFTAKQISDSQRLNFARTLVVETKVPLTDIAFTSGFQSIRRFNDAFLKKFARKPSDLRKKVGDKVSENSVTLLLRYRPPYDWSSMIAFLSSHHIDGVEHVDEHSYQRLFIDEYTKKPALAVVTHVPEKHALQLKIINSDTKSLFMLSHKIRRMFDLDSDPIVIGNAFATSRFLEKIYEKNPGLRLPRGWDPFETAIGTILGQLVTSEQARRLVRQLVENYGTKYENKLHPDLHSIFPSALSLSQKRILELGTTGQRKQTIIDFAKAIRNQKIDLSEYSDLEKLRASLKSIKGIGDWSAEYICLRAIGDTDAFPHKDLIIGRALENHPEIKSENIQPWRSYLSMHLWKEFAKTSSKKGKRKHATPEKNI